MPPQPVGASGDWAPQASAALTLRSLHIAEQSVAERMMLPGGGPELLRMPVTAYLVEHPSEGLLVIDPGPGRASAGSLDEYPGAGAARRSQLKLLSAPLADRLNELGHSPEQVRTLVVTHLHSDHAGGLADFPDAELLIDPREWQAGGHAQPVRGVNPSAYADRDRVRQLVFDGGPVGPFPLSHDLYGDGSVLLLSTPGHTAGHSSVLLDSSAGATLLVGDAAILDAHWQQPSPKGALISHSIEHDWRENAQTLWRVHQLAEHLPGLQVVAGHEPLNFDRLPEWPAPW